MCRIAADGVRNHVGQSIIFTAHIIEWRVNNVKTRNRCRSLRRLAQNTEGVGQSTVRHVIRQNGNEGCFIFLRKSKIVTRIGAYRVDVALAVNRNNDCSRVAQAKLIGNDVLKRVFSAKTVVRKIYQRVNTRKTQSTIFGRIQNIEGKKLTVQSVIAGWIETHQRISVGRKSIVHGNGRQRIHDHGRRKIIFDIR